LVQCKVESDRRWGGVLKKKGEEKAKRGKCGGRTEEMARFEAKSDQRRG
jgi:hypothetical protein